ncbi:MAG TPA: hypothetical protein VIU16_02170, partial [Gaiellaceae bacterium]
MGRSSTRNEPRRADSRKDYTDLEVNDFTAHAARDGENFRHRDTRRTMSRRLISEAAEGMTLEESHTSGVVS